MQRYLHTYLLGIMLTGCLMQSCILIPEVLTDDPDFPSSYIRSYHSFIPNRDLAHTIVEDNTLMLQYKSMPEESFTFEKFRNYENIYELYNEAGQNVGLVLQQDNVVASIFAAQSRSPNIFLAGIEKSFYL